MKNKSIYLLIALTILAVTWRVINNEFALAPNLEIVTAATVLAVIITRSKFALFVPIAAMIISDIFIGNSSIFVFTWSAFALVGISALFLDKFHNNAKKQILYSFGFAIYSSFAFFVITNFGVWAQGWYPATIDGLIQCYAMAIPFYRTMLIGNIIIVPSVVTLWQVVKNYQLIRLLVVDSLVRK